MLAMIIRRRRRHCHHEQHRHRHHRQQRRPVDRRARLQSAHVVRLRPVRAFRRLAPVEQQAAAHGPGARDGINLIALERHEAQAQVGPAEQHAQPALELVDLGVDDTLAGLVDNFSQIVGTLAVDLTDDDNTRAVQYLGDANAPNDGRFYGISPATKRSMLGINRYASSDFNRGGGANIIRGEFGDVYGLRIFESTNIEGSNAAGHDNGIWQRDAIALGMRMRPRTRRFDDIQNLSEQVAISVIYGVVETRDDHGVWARGA